MASSRKAGGQLRPIIRSDGRKYASAEAAGNEIGVSRLAVRKSARTGSTVHGFSFEFDHAPMKTPTPKPRGHWTLGKRRNDPGGGWPATLAALRQRMSHPVPGVVSCRALAEVIGVDDRNVRAYLSGEFLPTRQTAGKIAAWLKRVNGRKAK